VGAEDANVFGKAFHSALSTYH